MKEPKKIVEKLLSQNYTQRDIAAMIDVAESTISRIMGGMPPRLATAQRLWAIKREVLNNPKPGTEQK